MRLGICWVLRPYASIEYLREPKMKLTRARDQCADYHVNVQTIPLKTEIMVGLQFANHGTAEFAWQSGILEHYPRRYRFQ